MRACIALASVALLAACGGGSDTAAPEEAVVEEDSMAMPDSAGTYTGTDAEGVEMAWMLSDDGTYEATSDGEVVETGTWEDTMRGTCLTAEGGEGEECYNIQPGTEDGMVEVTGPDGETMTMSQSI